MGRRELSPSCRGSELGQPQKSSKAGAGCLQRIWDVGWERLPGLGAVVFLVSVTPAVLLELSILLPACRHLPWPFSCIPAGCAHSLPQGGLSHPSAGLGLMLPPSPQSGVHGDPLLLQPEQSR